MIDPTAATDLLMRLLAVEGVTGQEKNIAREHPGRPQGGRRRCRGTSATTTPTPASPSPTQTGNLIVELPGTKPRPAAAVHDAHGHRPAVCRGRPGPQGEQDRPAGRNGPRRRQPHRLRRPRQPRRPRCVKNKLPHPPLTLLFTVREECGLFGARHLDPATSAAGDGLQLRRPVGGGHHHRGRRGGPLGGGDPRQGVARRRLPRARHLGHAGRGAWRWPRSTPAAGSARS